MEVKAQLRHLRIAPRKVRLVADMVRNKKVEQAQALLDFNLKKGAGPMKKLFDQAVANAKNNLELDEKTLVIKEIFVDEGPKLKRWRARSRGRAMQIQKKTSHITLILEGQKGKKKPVKPKAEKPVEKPKEENKEETKKTVKHKAKRQIGSKTENKVSKKIFKRKSF